MMIMNWKIFFPISALLVSCHFFQLNSVLAYQKNETLNLISTKLGSILGKIRHFNFQKQQSKVNVFLGIRYGEAKRFSRSQPVQSWPEVYDATYERESCPQLRSTAYLSQISEDCLYLNIFKPTGNSNLPVMVWIHGGAFQYGSIYEPVYDGSLLASIGQVVVVTVNYRLGPFGFLYATDTEAQGNQAFSDQLLALKWVQENIDDFGGNPKAVTLFGESAGSMSISGLIASPLSQGLFHQAILQSGALNPYTNVDLKPLAVAKSKRLMEKLECYSHNLNQSLECLRSKPFELIVNASQFTAASLLNGELFWPILDEEQLPEASTLLKPNKAINLLFGVTHDEGTFYAALLRPEFQNDEATFTLDEIKLMISQMTSPIVGRLNSEKIVEFYTNHLNASNWNQVRQKVSDVIGDFVLTCPTILFGEQMAQTFSNNNFYAYSFDYLNSQYFSQLGCQKWMSVCHGSDTPYTFGVPLKYNSQSNLMNADQKISYDMIRFWTNFAKYGDPKHLSNNDSVWLPYLKKNQFISLNVSNDDSYRMNGNHYAERCQFLKTFITNL